MQIPFEVRSATPSALTANTGSQTVLAANAARRSAVIVNNGAVDVFLARGGTAVVNQGICLKAGGGAYEINATNLYKGIITAITASGTAALVIEEGV